MNHRLLSASLVLACLGSAPVARADVQTDKATAEALFGEARRLMAAGNFEQACPKLAESQRLDPAPGTTLNLANCYERAGKTASAWAAYKDAEAAASRADQKDRAALARKKAAVLEMQLATVTILVSPDATIPGLDVRRDGVSLAQSAWGTALPVDPGSHEVVSSAPGRRTWSTKLQVDAGTRQSVTVPKLEEEPVAVAPASDAPAGENAAATTGLAPSALVADTSTSPGQTQRIVGLTTGIVGLVAIGGGAFFGLKAGSTYDDAKAACGGTTACKTDEGLQKRSDADSQATLSTVAFIAGGALLAGGAVIYFTAPKKKTAAAAFAPDTRVRMGVSPSPQGAMFSMHGTF